MWVYAMGVPNAKEMNLAIRVRAREFETYEAAEAHAVELGGAALTMPGSRFLAISARDCERIERAGGPETARFVGGRRRGWMQTIEVGR